MMTALYIRKASSGDLESVASDRNFDVSKSGFETSRVEINKPALSR